MRSRMPIGSCDARALTSFVYACAGLHATSGVAQLTALQSNLLQAGNFLCYAQASRYMVGMFSVLSSRKLGPMTAFNNEISSADKIGLHLSEVGRLQNNAGSLLQFMAILFAISIYFFNALVFPESTHRLIFGALLGVYAVCMFTCSFLYLRCLTFSLGRVRTTPRSQEIFHAFSFGALRTGNRENAVPHCAVVQARDVLLLSMLLHRHSPCGPACLWLSANRLIIYARLLPLAALRWLEYDCPRTNESSACPSAVSTQINQANSRLRPKIWLGQKNRSKNIPKAASKQQ